ncbi:hypothetical protein OHA18_20220 [Kribbella sp. NBC_00709]|uniref:hypothetical protein n=1 Tax=Kribbella sp. NBC_00709 TaxID=2975972 RepID=UPI002E29CD36|nr:hypothetical protein [Kribbella sp. NBC_00709]
MERQASLIKATLIPVRRGESPVSLLKPVKKQDAKPHSLSALYGRGPQALHSDGAHLAEPPDIVILASVATSAVPTKLWKIKRPFLHGIHSSFRHGVFLVMNGRDSFYTTAFQKDQIRYDPGCMVPCDSRARKVVSFMEEALDDASDHHWNVPNMILAIDNRQVLHARADASNEPSREVHRIALRLPAVGV